VVIDEAHHVEDVATSYFGSQVSLAMIERACGRLQHRRALGRGILPALALALDAIDDPGVQAIAHGAAHWIDQRLQPACSSVLAEAVASFDELRAEFQMFSDVPKRGAFPPPRSGGGSGGGGKLRITPEIRATRLWPLVLDRTSRLSATLEAFAADCGGVLERLAMLDDADAIPPQVRYLATELGAIRGRLAAIAGALLEFGDDDAAACAWLELRRRGARHDAALSLHRAPIAVGPLLAKALFEPFKTAVLTSATLAVEGRFDFLHQRIGVDRIEPVERVETLRVASPFDFATQAILAVPADLPEPTAAGFEPASHVVMRRLLELTRGGTFLLFTSYTALDRAWFELANGLRAAGYLPLRQGELGRSVLLGRFASDPRAVLFATDSFWEGVDVRGDALRCVVIAKLPFRVPTEPLEEARVEAIAARGGDPFAERALPQAVLKLQQGFGRLIRSRTDRGAVVVLDSRLARKRYGQTFFASLPPARRVVGGTELVLGEVGRFFSPPLN
jgi:ATP-dependent DNA helicase DinG